MNPNHNYVAYLDPKTKRRIFVKFDPSDLDPILGILDELLRDYVMYGKPSYERNGCDVSEVMLMGRRYEYSVAHCEDGGRRVCMSDGRGYVISKQYSKEEIERRFGSEE